MAEHRRRYEELGTTLAEAGFLVWIYDQRGHGDSPPGPDARRHISPGNRWEALVEDARAAMEALGEALETDSASHAGAPLCVLGHSMGSLVLRDALRRPPSPVCAAVLMGTSGSGGMRAATGHLVAGLLAAVSGPSRPSRVLNDMTFGAYNRAIADAATEFDWLSRDREEVERYIADPLCGEVMSAHFFRELTRGLMRVSSRAAFAEVPRETSVLLASGTEDPVGDFGRGVREVAERFRAAGHPRIQVSLREGARHELLHETDRVDTVAEIVGWLGDRAAACQNGADREE
jgi:alpha-beta hydrolase superfamily lysophospholipase